MKVWTAFISDDVHHDARIRRHNWYDKGYGKRRKGSDDSSVSAEA